MELIRLVDWSYAACALTAVLIAVLYPAGSAIQDAGLKRRYRRMQLVTLVGAVVGAKLAFLFAELGWPMRPLTGLGDVVFSGRSITGGLLGGLFAAETARYLTGYPRPPNDRFAAVLPFSVAVGRIGCLVAGCCRGLPWNGPWAVAYDDGVLRHPAQLYEGLFHVAAGFLFLRLVARGRMKGRVFSLYLVLYGVFRFLTEPLRETPKFFSGASGYAILAVLMTAVGVIGVVLRTKRLPAPMSAAGVEA